MSPLQAQAAGVSFLPRKNRLIFARAAAEWVFPRFAAAVEGRATFVVTGDPHLLAVSEYKGVRSVSPRAFLDLLGS